MIIDMYVNVCEDLDLKIIVFMRFLVFLYLSIFVCFIEIIVFSDRVGEFKKINTEVIVCFVDL